MSTMHPDKDYDEEIRDRRERIKNLPKKQSKMYVYSQDVVDKWKQEIAFENKKQKKDSTGDNENAS